jgi:hypothetical protein
VQQSTDETQQLKNTTSTLRDELENSKYEYEAKLQQQHIVKVDEHSHLQETITRLREELETKHRGA